MDTILVVNAGSSSVKFQVFATDGTDKLDRLIKGQIDAIGTRPRLRARGADGALLIDQSYTAGEVSDPRAAIEVGGTWQILLPGIEFIDSNHRSTEDRRAPAASQGLSKLSWPSPSSSGSRAKLGRRPGGFCT